MKKIAFINLGTDDDQPHEALRVRFDQIAAVEPGSDGGTIITLLSGVQRYGPRSPYLVWQGMLAAGRWREEP